MHFGSQKKNIPTLNLAKQVKLANKFQMKWTNMKGKIKINRSKIKACSNNFENHKKLKKTNKKEVTGTQVNKEIRKSQESK